MNIAEMIGWAVIYVLSLGLVTLVGMVFFGLILLAIGYLEDHFKWVPLKYLQSIDLRHNGGMQVMLLIPLGKWAAISLLRQTNKGQDRSRPGGREHTSPNAPPPKREAPECIDIQ